VWAAAQAAGFTALDLAVFSAEPYRVEAQAYNELLEGGGRAVESYAAHVRSFAGGRRNFFLTKGDVAASDSRDRRGLLGEVDVIMDDDVSGTCEARNTGLNAWLTDADIGLGRVSVGVHLYDGAGGLVDRDFARIPLPPGGVTPGGVVGAAFSLDGLAPGRHRVEFDLVAEHVCWFEINGCHPVDIDVEVL
jgi:hypothetical protein